MIANDDHASNLACDADVDGQDADLVNQQRVNDAARKTPQRHTAIGSLEALVAWLDRMSERSYIKL